VKSLDVLLVSGVVVLVVISSLSTNAAATTCGREADATVVPPPVGVHAPRNVRPRVTMHADWRTRSFCPIWGNDRRCAEGHFDLELRQTGKSNEPFPITLRESRSGDIATVEIVPSRVLPENSRFEVVYEEVDRKEAPRLIATFATGANLDGVPPSFAGIRSYRRVGDWPGAAAPQARPRPKTSAQRGSVITIDMLSVCEGPGVFFEALAPAIDESTRPEDIRYAIWLAEPEASIDYTTPPAAYARGWPDYHRPPQPATLAIPFGTNLPPSDFSFPKGRRAMKFGVRAVDLAGNQSTASEIVVKLP
jgi:hypothetical protein